MDDHSRPSTQAVLDGYERLASHLSRWIYEHGEHAAHVLYPRPPDAVTNGLQFYLGPGPADAIYTVQYGAKLRIVNMVADGDTPLIRPEWQDVYILKAKMKIFDWLGQMDRVQETQVLYEARLQQMWTFDQETEESSWRMRDTLAEMAYSPYTDVNRALFVPFGR